MTDAAAKPQGPCAPGPPVLERPEGSAPAPRGEAVPDTGMLCLAMMLAFHKMPANPAQLRHEHAPAHGMTRLEDLARAAKRLGLKARIVRLKTARLDRAPLPAIAETPGGNFFILARVDREKALAQAPGNPPETLTHAGLAERWTGRVLMTARSADLAGAARRFDIAWFIPAIVKYRRMFAEVLAASFFLQLFGLIAPLFFQVIIDKVLVHRGLTTLDVLVVGLLAVTFFETLLGWLRTYIFSHTTSRVDVELGARLFHHLTALPVSYFEARAVGQTVARVRELENVRNFITGSALTVILDLFFTFVFFAAMFYFSERLTWIVLGSLPFYAALSAGITPGLRRRVEEQFRRGAANQAFLVESVSGIETLKTMAVEPQMRQRWEEQLAAYVRASFRTVMLGAFGSQSVMLVNKVTTGLILWFGAQAVLAGELTVGMLVAFNMLANQVSQPIVRLATLWQDFQQFRISLDKLGDVLNAPTEPGPGPNRPSLPAIDGDIRLEEVTFRYRPGMPEALRNVSLHVEAGQVVGIVGRSGSGKSTLVKLVQRLHVPERGRVLVDGVDLAMVDPAWLRRQVGVVPQESVLFNRPVHDNIALSDPAMGMEAVVRAARLAGAHDFIAALPEGYDTVIGERGASLSGGQRQRIAIARALVANPRVLIFDEATSALDYESERAVQDNMRAICRGRTVLVVAHRLTTMRLADRILVVDGGEIVEDGTHGTLVEAGGIYAELYRHQVEAVA